jgi:transposase
LQRERNRLEKADATGTPALIRQSTLASIVFREKQRAKLQQAIDDHIQKHPDLFQSAEQRAAYLGLAPV